MGGLRVPRNTAYIQDQVILTEEHHSLEFVSGGLNWSPRRIAGEGEDKISRERGNDIDYSGSIREEEIVFICQEDESEPEPREAEKLGPTLVTPAKGYTVYLVRENPGSSEEPFRLASVSTPRLPQEWLDRHLLKTLPVHLVGREGEEHNGDQDGVNSPSSPWSEASPPELHVIVSTKSGTGLASAVYNSVLQKLLAVLGLRVGDDLTPPDSPGGGGAGGQHKRKNAAGRAGRSYNLFVTQSRDSIRQLARAKWSAEAMRQRSERLSPSSPSPSPIGQQLIILLSGDGGVVDLLNGAGEPSGADEPDDSHAPPLPAVALLPLGTGNALFHSLHKPLYREFQGSPAPEPSHLVLGLRTLFRGATAPLPTFRVSFSAGSILVPPASGEASEGEESEERDQERGDEGQATATATDVADAETVDHLLGAIVASYGFHSQLVWESDTPAYRRHGAKRFGMVAGELLKIDHAYDAAVEVRRPGSSATAAAAPLRARRRSGSTGAGRDDSSDGKFTYVLAAMVSNMEKAFTISPAARPLDGQLRLVSFGAVGAEKTMEIMQRAYDDGAHVRMTWPRPAAVAAQGLHKGDGSGNNTVEKEEEEDHRDGDGDNKVVGYEEVDEVKVTIHEEDPRWRKVCIDGTIVEVPRDGWMKVRRMAKSRFRVLADRSVLP